MQEIKQEKITVSQLLILMFVTKISSVIMYPESFSGILSVWSLMPSLLISIACIFIISLPIILCTHYEKSGLIRSMYDGKAIPLILIVVSIYRGMSDLYRFNGFSIEYGGLDLSQFFIVALIFTAAFYGAWRGIEGIVRFSALVFMWVVLGSIIVTAGLLPSFDTELIRRLGTASSEDAAGYLPFVLSDGGELILLLCFLGRTKGRAFQNIMRWNIFQGLFLISMLILVSGTMGIYLKDMTFPFYHITEGAGFLQRLHPVFIGIVISAFVCRLGACLIIIRESLKSLSYDEKTAGRLFPVFACLIVVGVVALNNAADFAEVIFNNDIMLISFAVITILIPLIRLGSVLFSRKGRRGIAAILSVLMICLTFSGCKGIPLNQRLIIQGIGIDRIENEYKMTLLTLDTDADESENAVKIIRGTGKDIEQAKRQIEESTGKRCLFSQCLFVIMNRKAADEDDNSLGFFCNNKEIIKTLNLMVSDDSSRLLTDAVEKNGYHSEDINMVTDSSVIKSDRPHCTIFDYIAEKNYGEKGLSLPVIEKDRKTGMLISQKSYTLK